ncbi:hypothetical protein QTO34_018339 [Cnephaeus nilssonii]|uniref:Uncharacterized protein n=1 Tax=Cnephaeus nilssonii TaxID=3371016 RepID=A0AA40LQ34_CNENI|nr:hypothetical protein QTO34_018339 [Eptesicus nilssonii]
MGPATSPGVPIAPGTPGSSGMGPATPPGCRWARPRPPGVPIAPGTPGSGGMGPATGHRHLDLLNGGYATRSPAPSLLPAQSPGALGDILSRQLESLALPWKRERLHHHHCAHQHEAGFRLSGAPPRLPKTLDTLSVILKEGHPLWRNSFYIQCTGSLGKTRIVSKESIKWLKGYCGAFFYGLTVKLLEPVPVSTTGCSFRVIDSTKSLLIHAGHILKFLKKTKPKDAIVGMTMVDLHSRNSWNFVFG